MTTNRKFRIGIDMDDTLVQFIKALREYYAHIKRINVSDLPEPKTWQFAEEWGMEGVKELVDLMRKFAFASEFTHLVSSPGALNVAKALKVDGHSLVIVTARDTIADNSDGSSDYFLKSKIHLDTLQSLRNMGIEYDELCFVKDKSNVKVDILFDDSASQLLKVVEKDVIGVCMDRPYNKEYPGLRVSNWAQFYDHVVRWAK